MTHTYDELEMGTNQIDGFTVRIEQDDMPPFIYKLGHAESKIDPAEMKILKYQLIHMKKHLISVDIKSIRLSIF